MKAQLQEFVDGIACVEEAPDNPDETMMVQLTLRDLAVLNVGLRAAALLFPETKPAVRSLIRKLMEVGVGQDFFADADDEDVLLDG